MMDRLINSENKRFVAGVTLYVLLTLQFFIGLFKVSSLFVSIKNSSDLLQLTTQQTRLWYWPIELVANLIDHRFSIVNVVFVTFRTIPTGFWIAMVLTIYLVGFKLTKDSVLYRHQLRFVGLMLVSWISVFIQMLLFVYGFFGGSVATAIARVNVSGYVGIILGVVLSVLSIIMLTLLWIDIHPTLNN